MGFTISSSFKPNFFKPNFGRADAVGIPQAMPDNGGATYTKILKDIAGFATENALKINPPLSDSTLKDMLNNLQLLAVHKNDLYFDEINSTMRRISALLFNEKIPLQDRVHQLQQMCRDIAARDNQIPVVLVETRIKLETLEINLLMDHLRQFVRDNASEQVSKKVSENFQIFQNNLTNENFYSSHRETVLIATIDCFQFIDNQLLCGDSLSKDQQVTAIANMSGGLITCSGGVVSTLEEALLKFQNLGSGIAGQIFDTKISIIKQVIVSYVNETHQLNGLQIGNEIHYVNAYYNHLADELGVTPVDDLLVRAAEKNISVEQFEQCRCKVLKAFDPVSVATWMAEDYLSPVKQIFVSSKGSISEKKQVVEFLKKHDEIKVIMDQQFGEISTHRYLRIDQNDDWEIEQIKFNEHATEMVANVILEKFKETEIIDLADPVTIAEDGENGKIMTRHYPFFWYDNKGDCTELEFAALIKIKPSTILENLHRQGIESDEQAAMLDGVVKYLLGALRDDDAAPHCDAHSLNVWFEEMFGLFQQGKVNEDCIVGVAKIAQILNKGDVMNTLFQAGVPIERALGEGQTVLMIAAKTGAIEIVKELMRQGLTGILDKVDARGYTALMYAILEGHIDIGTLLIDSGADKTVTTKNGELAITIAARNGRVDILDKLILSYRDEPETQPLSRPHLAKALNEAIRFNHVNATQFLIGQGAEPAPLLPSVTSLMTAAKFGAIDVAKMLIHSNSSVYMDIREKRGRTALMCAIDNGQDNVARYLIERGANLNIQDTDGKTAAFYAVERGNTSIIKLLIEGGFDALLTDSVNRTVVVYALKLNHVQIIEDLIQYDRRIVDFVDNEQRTILIYAALWKETDGLKILERYDAIGDINRQDKKGNSPVIAAAKLGNLPLVNFLISKGADLSAVDSEGHDALWCAIKRLKFDVAEALIRNRGSSNDNDYRLTRVGSQSPEGYEQQQLFDAVDADNGEVVGFLIEQGCDVNLHTGGLLPINKAVLEGKLSALKKLLEKGADIGRSVFPHRDALIEAITHKKTEAAKLLIEHLGRNATGLDDCHVYESVATRQPDILKLLIDAGFDINEPSRFVNATPLFLAVRLGDVTLVNMLLDAGADFRVKCSRGKTATALARELKNVEIIQILREAKRSRRKSSHAVQSADSSLESKKHQIGVESPYPKKPRSK